MRKSVLLTMLFMAVSVMVYAQNRTITGKVSDKKGDPIANATISVKGKNVATISSNDGVFQLNVPVSGGVMVITAVGQQPVEVNISQKTAYDISMKPLETNMDEIVVTGYAAIQKEKYAGAVAIVSAREIENVAVTRFDQMLQGLVPGVQIFTGSGQPGSNNIGVVIRGVGSINGGSDPLYILDGVPIEASIFGAINPDDIANISILKDASSKALYGARGANGVIVLTSKRGKPGKVALKYSGQVGTNDRARNTFEMMNSRQYLELEEAFHAGAGWKYSPNNPANASRSDEEKALFARVLDTLRNTNTDWTQYFFRKGKFQDHNITLSGGKEGLTFLLSGNYHDETGIAHNSDFKRYTLRSNIEYNQEKLSMALHLYGGYTSSNFIQSEYALALANPYAAIYLGLPYETPLAPDGTYLTSKRIDELYGSINKAPLSVQAASSRLGTNALARTWQTLNMNNQLKTIGNFDIRYDVFRGLGVFGAYGFDFRETVNTSGVYPNRIASTDKKTTDGSLSKNLGRMLNLNSRTGLAYNRTLGVVHEVNAQVFFEANRYRLNSFNFTGYGINPKLLNTPAGITQGSSNNGYIPVVGGSQIEKGLNSFVGSLIYSYQKKFSFNGNLRFDGSSQVAKKYLWHPFYSVGLAWDIKEEVFLKNNQTISKLQFRFSNGTTANANGLTAYGALAFYGAVNYAGTPGLAATYPGNSEYNWEFSKDNNIGVDFGLFRNRIRGVLDMYIRKTKNLLLDQLLSYPTGFSALIINAGEMRNKGIEFGISGDVLRDRSFDLIWTIGINYGYNKNEITQLGQATEYPLGTSIVRVGLPYGAHYTNKWGGVDPQTGEPQYYTKDGKLTKAFSAADQVAEFGSNNPPTAGGFSSNISYKGFYLNLLFSFVNGYKIFSNETYFLLNGNFVGSYNQDVEMATYWKKPGDITKVPKPGSARQFNSSDILDASYLRFRTLDVGYNFPKKWLTSLQSIKMARVFFSAQNIYTWTKKDFKGFDPEFNTNLQRFGYPPPKTLTVGVNVSF